MRFSEINLLGLYIAPIAGVLLAAWLIHIGVRRVADRFGLIQQLWRPALFELAVYVILVSTIVLLIGRWGL
jgi:protein AaeX